MAFRSPQPTTPPPATPEQLYRDLPRRAGAVPNLWVHQGDVLRTFADEHAETKDLALELPTGTGKTLPGLLIADWSRRSRTARVAYACPTQQLARQVAATADRQGVPAVVLMGKAQDWSLADETAYVGANALAICTYSTVFNSHPKLDKPDVLLFDDAHAGEQYVAQAYSVTVKRWENPGTYDQLLECLTPALDGMLVQRLREAQDEPGHHQQVRLLLPLRHTGVVPAMETVLASMTGPDMFRFAMIREALPSCLVYLTATQILIRPYIPPTTSNKLFTNARQRLYLSATLGDGGELERSFGRSPIARLALPDSAPTPRSGRRFFVFPDLITAGEPRDLAQKIVTAAGKALILAPDTDTAVQTATDLASSGWPVMTTNHVSDGMEPFAKAEHAVCGLASRYDGLDLPGDSCRAVVLEGKPDKDSLQEKFLSERVRAGSTLAERVRTRVVQGAGRCTRGPDDWALVVVLGASLTSYLVRPETLAALSPELQAEIAFGQENSRGLTADEVMDNVGAFLAQGDTWHDQAEPALADLRRAAVRQLPDGTNALASSVADEIEACALAAQGRWGDASRVAQNVARALGAGGDATRGYRAFWLYLAGTWADQAGADANDVGARRTAQALIEQAEQAAKPGTWTRELAPLPDQAAEQLSPADEIAIETIAGLVEAGVAAGKHQAKIDGMLIGLAERKPGLYEPQLTVLGTLLGADASKPPGKGRCDSAWCWGNELWMPMEAKSDHEPTGVVPHKDIRQANDQLRLLATDRTRDAAPPGSATVIVSPKPAVDPDGVSAAELHVHLVGPDRVLELARDAVGAWADILAERAGRDSASLRRAIKGALERRGVLPSQVQERLTDQPVSLRGSA